LVALRALVVAFLNAAPHCAAGLYSDMPDKKPANTAPMKLGVRCRWCACMRGNGRAGCLQRWLAFVPIHSLAADLLFGLCAWGYREILCRALGRSVCSCAPACATSRMGDCVFPQVAYNVFDGEELLLDSIRSIKPNVDFIAIVYQMARPTARPRVCCAQRRASALTPCPLLTHLPIPQTPV